VKAARQSVNGAGRDLGRRASPFADAAAGSVSIFEEAPELLQDLRSRATELAHVRVSLLVVEPGPWAPPAPADGARRHFGFFLLDGLIIRRLTLNGRTGAELLGSGDLLQPWIRQPPYDTLVAEPGWEVLEWARLGVLDGRFAAQMAPLPEVAAALVGRAVERARTLAFQHVASHTTGLRGRLLAVFWALADRWGRVTPGGVVIPFRLTHATLAELVGASRPSVSTALAQLAREGSVERAPDGWLLHRRSATLREHVTTSTPAIAS
jgi:CRP/FNR family transcriptional regulator, cyclic AMP receptor protein